MDKKTGKYTEKTLAIFNAALDLIAENGFNGSPIAKIAKKANISIGIMYYYFKSKDQLINELYQYVEEDMSRTIKNDINIKLPVKDLFLLLCKRLIHYSFNNPRESYFFYQYIESPFGVLMRRTRHSRDKDHVPQNTLLYPFFLVFNKAKKKKLIKDLPNILLFTLIHGSMSNFVRDVGIGIIDYSKGIEDTVIDICWDAIKG